MPPKAMTVFRKQVIEMVLGTDMKQHFTVMSLFSSKFPSNSSSGHGTKNTSGTASPGGGAGGRARSPSGGGSSSGGAMSSLSSMDIGKLLVAGSSNSAFAIDEEGRSLAFQMALKCADLGHLCSSKAVHRK